MLSVTHDNNITEWKGTSLYYGTQLSNDHRTHSHINTISTLNKMRIEFFDRKSIRELTAYKYQREKVEKNSFPQQIFFISNTFPIKNGDRLFLVVSCCCCCFCDYCCGLVIGSALLQFASANREGRTQSCIRIIVSFHSCFT